MLPMMLIDTREPEPEPEPRRDPSPLAAGLGLLYPWPIAILWLWIGGVLLDDVPGMLFAVAALLVSFWRLSKAYPDTGLSSHQQ